VEVVQKVAVEVLRTAKDAVLRMTNMRCGR